MKPVLKAFALLVALALVVGAIIVGCVINTGVSAKEQPGRLEIKTADGKTVAVVRNDKTTYTHGKSKADDKMLKVGERVVVDVEGKETLIAKSIKVGAATK